MKHPVESIRVACEWLSIFVDEAHDIYGKTIDTALQKTREFDGGLLGASTGNLPRGFSTGAPWRPSRLRRGRRCRGASPH